MRKIVIVTALMFISLYTYAGDVASFVNLGFSADSRYYMFAEYGVSSKGVYSELFAVDVNNNVFVPNGVLRKQYPVKPSSMEDGTGALYKNILDSAALTSRYSIDYMNKGRYIYVNINGDDAREIEIRDFVSGKSYKLSLIQEVNEKDGVYYSSFIINVLAINNIAASKAYVTGTPGVRRKDVSGYRIKKVIISPDETNIVIAVEKIMNVKGLISIRYMVETLKL